LVIIDNNDAGLMGQFVFSVFSKFPHRNHHCWYGIYYSNRDESFYSYI